MRKRPAYGGIERKFFRSILWVGIVPMTLALTIGYVFAREGQWIATQQNQSTAARKTAEGIGLAVQGRLIMISRAAQDSEITRVLRKYPVSAEDLPPILKRLQRKAENSGELKSVFLMYDRDGRLVGSTGGQEEANKYHPEWLGKIEKASFTDFTFIEAENRYVAYLCAPVTDPETGQCIGFLLEIQDVQDLLDFSLGGVRNRPGEVDVNNYQVVYLGADRKFCISASKQANGKALSLGYDKVDPRLSDRLIRSPDKDSDSFFLWRYSADGLVRPVLMAYQRLFPGIGLYFIVYRPVSDVFANINLGAVITLVVSSIAIGFFCIIGYRIVNSNIIRPVALLNEGAQIIRQGDLDLKLKINTGDEIEELAVSFNKMAAVLRQNIRQLEESEEKYRSLITSMRDGIYQVDNQWTLILVNPAGAEILGFARPEDAHGASLREMFVVEMDYSRLAGELARRRFVEHTRVWVKTAGSKTICVEISASSMLDDDGNVIGAEGTFRDVTQNVRLEQESRERSERISAINQITNVINSSLEAGRVRESIVMEVRRLMEFDFASVSMLGQEEDSFRTQQYWPEPRRENTPEDLHPLGESCLAWVVRERRCLVVENLRAGDNPFAVEFPNEIQSCLCAPLYASGRILGSLNLGARMPDGFTRHEIEVVEQLTPHIAVAIRNAELLENLQVSLEEVTEAREKLHEMNEELKTLDEMKTNLLSNVSHELRTPLVAVMGYTDMILNGKVGPINEVQQEYLGISLRNIEKLVTLIENLLDFSRLHRGAEEMMFDAFDLVDCAKTSLQIVQPVADGRGIELQLMAPEEAVLVEGDKGKMGQVFNNLLSNAVKFNASGGKVAIEMRMTESTVEVAVIDTGIGIPKDALDKIFTRFYQVDSSSTRKYGGTGIGLAIAQDIVRLHGSRITVTSELGKGSKFRFSLPLSGVQRRVAGEEPKLTTPAETHLLVEIVTQDRALNSQLRNMLLEEGMDVIHAAYPSVAVSLANRYSPDCILVDTEAGPLGSVVMEEILSDPSAGNIPIILLTNDDQLYHQYQMDVAGRIRRGFRKSMLLSGIHYALSKGVSAGEQLGDKVLIVDDDPEIVTFISRCLENEGYSTNQCATGEDALELVGSGEYWLVLLDIAMPGIDGWETCERIKSDGALAGIRVYIVTAKPVDKTMNKVHECGADGFLLKPFKPDDLLALVQGFESRKPQK